ncbi:MAG: hypothetical protein PHH98_01785 [Candidatus Gracilibacteria bacterium]|nr:hypothetical protein [Candidatus Gracilibacteria bacterium]
MKYIILVIAIFTITSCGNNETQSTVKRTTVNRVSNTTFNKTTTYVNENGITVTENIDASNNTDLNSLDVSSSNNVNPNDNNGKFEFSDIITITKNVATKIADVVVSIPTNVKNLVKKDPVIEDTNNTDKNETNDKKNVDIKKDNPNDKNNDLQNKPLEVIDFDKNNTIIYDNQNNNDESITDTNNTNTNNNIDNTDNNIDNNQTNDTYTEVVDTSISNKNASVEVKVTPR